MQKKVHSSKESKPLFAYSEPSPAYFKVPRFYKVILNSFKKYNILVLYGFLVNFYSQSQFM